MPWIENEVIFELVGHCARHAEDRTALLPEELIPIASRVRGIHPGSILDRRIVRKSNA
jgi:hypothetical protein